MVLALARLEVDLIVESGGKLLPVEIKSTATPHPAHVAALQRWPKQPARARGTASWWATPRQARWCRTSGCPRSSILRTKKCRRRAWGNCGKARSGFPSARGKVGKARGSTRPVAAVTDDRRFGDVELRITGRDGPTSWDAVVVRARDLPAKTPALLRLQQPDEFKSGSRVRVLDGALARDPEDATAPLVVTLGSFSEAYRVE